MRKTKVKWICGVVASFIIGWGIIQYTPRVCAAATTTYEQIKILVDIMGYIKENYVEERETQELIYGAAAGMVKKLDPFSQFMEPKIHKEMKVETKGEFGGLGIRISMRDNWLTVITPLPGTPAYKIGILPNDKIIKIEADSTYEITLNEAVEKLRGKPGTDVTITVSRKIIDAEGKEVPETKDYTITRGIIKIESVQSHLETDTVGYVRLIEFSQNTATDMHKALLDLKKNGMEKLIIDLRNNPGGLLNVAVNVCEEFLPHDSLIVYTQGRNKSQRHDYRSKQTSAFFEIPLIILINDGSASGSEIVAGALQDSKRAVILGTKTFGKASVQSVIPLSDGSGLRLTTAKYYTPSGKNIHRNDDSKEWGITPDIEVAVPHEVQIKLRAQEELVYEKGKKPHPKATDAERIKDEVLERALQVFKTQDIFQNIDVFLPKALPKAKKEEKK